MVAQEIAKLKRPRMKHLAVLRKYLSEHAKILGQVSERLLSGRMRDDYYRPEAACGERLLLGLLDTHAPESER